MSAADQIRAFIRDLRAQIGVAEDAGAEHNDLCVVFPAAYLGLVGGWPTIDLDGKIVVLVPKLWARDRADEAVAEIGGSPSPSPSGPSVGLLQTIEPAASPTASPTEETQQAMKLWLD